MTMVGNSATGGDGSPFLELPQRHLGPPTSQTFGPLRTAKKDLSKRGEDEDPLRPDPGNLHEFQVEDNKFAFSPGQLGKLINPKNLPALKALGGIEGLEKGLRTDLRAGLSLDETILDEVVTFEEATSCSNRATFQTSASMRKATEHAAAKHSNSFKDRLRVFKDNRLPEKKSKSLFELMWIALMDKVLLLLSAAALISLALGLYQIFGVKHHEGPSVDWVEGVAIIVAVVIVIVVGAGDDWQKERQFVKLNKKKEDRTVKVIRSGRSLQISVYDLMVGDICHLEPGDLIPADGVFITGYNLKCDESSATGESDQVKKYPAHLAQQAAGTTSKLDPFIISGAKVLEGVGIYVVTSVGIHSSFGKTMMALREESSTATPLQVKLECLADAIAKLGVAASLLLFVVLLIRFLYSLAWKTSNLPDDYACPDLMNILIAAVTVIVIAIPEGLPLAITLVLAFATMRMLKENNLVRVLRACVTMGNATTVCTDKTGTLTQNKMTINRGINISRTEVVKGVSAFILRTAVSRTQTAKINFAADYEPASPARNLGTRERAVGLPRKSGFRGMLNGINALMLADSGSEINLITQKLALQHHLSIDKSNKYIRKVRLANGGFLQIIGRATAEWSFEDSSGFIHHITFDVAAQCTNDIIVGHNFLQETCSFEERNKHRFIEIPRWMAGNRLSINSIGVSHHRLPILARASKHRRIRVDAIPDTGAEGNIISAVYVRKHRLRVYKTNKIFIFPDGTMQDSLGRVKLEVSFGNNPMQSVTTYFEVMRQCVHGAILGHDFVFDNNVYADNAHCLVETTADFGFNLVDIDEKPELNDQQELNRLKDASQIAHDMVVASRTRGRANIPSLTNSTPSTTPAPSLPVQPHRQPRRWSRALNRLRQICQKSD